MKNLVTNILTYEENNCWIIVFNFEDGEAKRITIHKPIDREEMKVALRNLAMCL